MTKDIKSQGIYWFMEGFHHQIFVKRFKRIDMNQITNFCCIEYLSTNKKLWSRLYLLSCQSTVSNLSSLTYWLLSVLALGQKNNKSTRTFMMWIRTRHLKLSNITIVGTILGGFFNTFRTSTVCRCKINFQIS